MEAVPKRVVLDDENPGISDHDSAGIGDHDPPEYAHGRVDSPKARTRARA
jgi:hypothetical protein